MTAELSQPLRILDIAAGGGDVALGVAELAAKENAAVEVHGCDISSTAIDFANRRAKLGGVAIASFFRLDALRDPLPADYDVVMCTLFLHHLSDDEACNLLRKMGAAARQCVLVDDLRRTALGYAYAWAGGRLLTRSPIVHTDGPLSVRAAFTLEEIAQLANRAGLEGARFVRHWPERYLMTWKKAA